MPTFRISYHANHPHKMPSMKGVEVILYQSCTCWFAKKRILLIITGWPNNPPYNGPPQLRRTTWMAARRYSRSQSPSEPQSIKFGKQRRLSHDVPVLPNPPVSSIPSKWTLFRFSFALATVPDEVNLHKSTLNAAFTNSHTRIASLDLISPNQTR